MNKEVRITLRLPEKLHEMIYNEALKDVRSLNGQIVTILLEHYRSIEPPKEKKRSER